MGSIIDRALDIINDHLKDQTSSFSDPVTLKPMARGGHVLEDDYPTHYLPNVGRQVMAEGGMPDDPIKNAFNVARSVHQNDPIIPAPTHTPTPAAPPVPSPVASFEGRVGAPLSRTWEGENVPGVIVSPRPGKGSGPRPAPQRGVNYEDPEYTGFGEHGEEPSSHEEFSHSSPPIAGAALPPPIQHPLQNEPRMEKIVGHTQKMVKSKGFKDLVRDHVGLDPDKLKLNPILGTWKGEIEPSFVIEHPDMQHEHAAKLANMLGFGLQQDQTIHVSHNADEDDNGDSARGVLIGHKNNKRLNQRQISDIHKNAAEQGLDFSITKDGKAAKFLHFGEKDGYKDFLSRVNQIGASTGLDDRYNINVKGEPIDAKDYLRNVFQRDSGVNGLQDGSERSPDLFGRIVDHVLAPYAKKVAGEGYRLSPERLKETFGLTDDEADKVRSSMLPTRKSGDRTTVPLMDGSEELDVRPTGERGKRNVNDVLYSLQNRAAEKGQIDPGDYSDDAKKIIAEDMAKEVAYHVKNSKKSAVGWYDAALSKAKNIYHKMFPALEHDPNLGMMFDAVLGITSQGNDVHSNSIYASRLIDSIHNKGMTIPEAVKELSGSFGAQTNAIEGNLMKFHHLVEQNGVDKMRSLFNQTKTVGEWNKILRENPSLKVPGQDTLSMQGATDQKVTGWSVFGPKIGSFINNLHGDYSTLTADLWFSRTWNRLLGHNFLHSPMAEHGQFNDFKDAMKAQFMHHNGLPHEQSAGKTTNGQYRTNPKTGEVLPWEFGEELKGMSHDEFKQMINDPAKLEELAADYYDKYKKGGFKAKSDVYRRAKNWMENRDNPVAAPRGDVEREFQQNTAEAAQKILKKKYGLNISIADIQAALWFHEKELFQKLGVASKTAQPADYEDAARTAYETFKKGDLYKVKSRKEKPAKAFGGGISPIELRGDNDFEDQARRLILWSYAAAPLGRPLARADGGAIDDPVNKALDVVGSGSSPASAVDTARNLNPSGFYSAAAEAASKFPQRAPIDQIISKIKGQPNVKQAELDNANLTDAFAGQRSVDPKEVARHLQENVPQIGEKVYGGKTKTYYKPEALLDRPKRFEGADDVYRVGPEGKEPHYIAVNRGSFNVLGPSGYHNSFNSLNDAAEYANQSIAGIEPTTYQDYTIPGGENYREVVLTFPGKKKYRSSHWSGVDNPVAHLRMSDRDNGKTLHLEELQSDWGQEGRHKGFKTNEQNGFTDEEREEFKALNVLPDAVRTPEQTARLNEFYNEFNRKLHELPSAPYVTDTNQWVDLGLKRALMEAAKGGHDKIVITPGAEQARRYDLSTKLSSVHWSPDSKHLSAVDHEGYPVFQQKVEQDELHKYLGKDIASKLLDSKVLPNAHRFEGDTVQSLFGKDMKIGEEPMKRFYDKLVPERLNKIVAQYDKDAKVATHSYPLSYEEGTGQQEDIDWEGRPVEGKVTKQTHGHVLHITPQLRAAILKGLPAFKSGGDVGNSPIIDHAFKVLSKYPR